MTSPTDTIREALVRKVYRHHEADALAALTEVEQHLRSVEGELATELQLAQSYYSRAVAAEQRANDLADALREARELTDEALLTCAADLNGDPWAERKLAEIRAALDRQEQT